ncbi:hypothetical protein [Neobacillus sp. YIM B06451]|uniref:hypothetical protein n=1 Tax=Neobacillus sp. YIM B06451 TaxID=3070994 RepID=UPI00292EA8C2|nr:hypothetical protein [Neobacillus sp. YIM B06451]
MSRIFFIILLCGSLTTTGCSPNNAIREKEIKSKNVIIPEKIIQNKPVTTLLDNRYDFTYLENLPEDKLVEYNRFIQSGNTNHLIEFTPEQIVMVFMNLVFNHNVDRIYDITYNDGNLPSLEIFINEYREYLSPQLEDNYLKFRFYDAIRVDENTKKEEELAVVIEISYGTSKHSVAYALKKEKNIWKMRLYNIVEQSKKEED